MALLLFLISCGSSPEGNYSDGKRWFSMQHCAGCHGEGGSGGRAPKIQQTELSYRELLSKVRINELIRSTKYIGILRKKLEKGLIEMTQLNMEQKNKIWEYVIEFLNLKSTGKSVTLFS